MIREQQVPTIQKNRFLFKYHEEVVDEIVQVLQATRRQVPVVQTVQTTVEIPQRQVIDGDIDSPVIMQREVPAIRAVQNIAIVTCTVCGDRITRITDRSCPCKSSGSKI